MTKEKVIQAIKKLPDNFSVDDVLDKIMLIEKIERGIEQSKQNQLISDDELNKHLPKWLK